MQIGDLAQLFVRQKIVQCQPAWIAGKARAELRPRLARDALPRHFYRQFWRHPNQVLGDIDNDHRRRRKP